MIAYSKIFKQAFEILRSHKFLWTLGLFLVWGEAFNFFTFRVNSNENQVAGNYIQWVQDHALSSTGFLLIGLLLVVFLLQLYFRAKAAIYIGTKAIIEKKDTGFSKAFKTSKHFYIRIFGVWLITIFLLMLAFVILASPVLYLSSQHLTTRAALLGIVAIIIFIPIAIIAALLNNLAPIFVVYNDLKIGESISLSFEMVKKFWPGMLGFSILLGLLTSVVLSLLAAVVSVGVVILGQLSYNTSVFHPMVGLFIWGFIALIAFLFFTAGITAYQQICWVLLFNDLVKPQKLEEEEIVPVPEVI